MIEKNEPITKFTKAFTLYDADLDLRFDEVFPVLSATRQSNNAIVTHENRPIGFGLEQLEISSMNDLTTSELFKLLSQCPNITRLEYSNGECKYDGMGDCPVFNSLKSLGLLTPVSDKKNDVTVALKILELAPNLEYLHFKYCSVPLDGTSR